MKTAAQSAIFVGTAVTAAIALLPYIRDFFLTAYVAGAFAAVWFAIRKRHEHLSLGEGARLGFLSGFCGLLVASSIYDMSSAIIDYRLWQIQHLDRIVTLFADKARDAFRPSIWMFVTVQVVVAAICAGAFGAPSGILGVKIFQGKEAR